MDANYLTVRLNQDDILTGERPLVNAGRGNPYIAVFILNGQLPPEVVVMP